VTQTDTEKAANSGYATIDGLRVYYELHGGAPTGGKTPIVLLHGGVMTIDTAFAEDLIPRFSRTRPVIAIEQQGHGHTGDRDGPAEVGRMVEDTAGVLAYLGVKQAHFFGHSLGGMISMGMAIRHPRIVRSVTALGSTYVLEGMLTELVPQAGSLSACSARYNVRDDSSKRLTELAEPFPAKGTSQDAARSDPPALARIDSAAAN